MLCEWFSQALATTLADLAKADLLSRNVCLVESGKVDGFARASLEKLVQHVATSIKIVEPELPWAESQKVMGSDVFEQARTNAPGPFSLGRYPSAFNQTG
ncbi:hypothetical protein F4679DRAFT_585976 [Xylaria curta]|nr:hypothetical protein F4679DRAFT_585976 [Xylaria curta]